jgi:hypothetical protein
MPAKILPAHSLHITAYHQLHSVYATKQVTAIPARCCAGCKSTLYTCLPNLDMQACLTRHSCAVQLCGNSGTLLQKQQLGCQQYHHGAEADRPNSQAKQGQTCAVEQKKSCMKSRTTHLIPLQNNAQLCTAHTSMDWLLPHTASIEPCICKHCCEVEAACFESVMRTTRAGCC